MKTYEKKSFPRTANDLTKMMKKGTISFENAVQRSLVWKNTLKDNRKSMLIDSIIRGFPVPPMYCNCMIDSNNKVYDFIDGKQRTNTIVEFMNNEFPLVGVPSYEIENEDGDETEYEFNGLKYSELPDYVQDIIKTYSFTIYYYENMEQSDVEEMFLRLNNGKSLTAIELARVEAKSKAQLKEICNHPLFADAFNDREIAGYKNVDYAIKAYTLLFTDSKSLESKDVKKSIRECDISIEEISKMNDVFTKILDMHNEVLDNTKDKKLAKVVGKRLYTKTHMLSIIPLVEDIVSGKIEKDCLASWAMEFYAGEKKASISSEYNDASAVGSGKTASVTTRLQIIEDSYKTYCNSQN